MRNDEKFLKITKALAEKKKIETERTETIKTKYKDKSKIKALTTAERLDRIEELLGLK